MSLSWNVVTALSLPGKLPSEVWMSLLFGFFWRLLCWWWFLTVVFSFLLCWWICTSLVLCWQSHCAAFSLLKANGTSVQWWRRDAPGKGAGQTSFLAKEQAVSLALLSCSDLKNNSVFVRSQQSLCSARQNSRLFIWRATAHPSAFLLQAHSWAFSSPCPNQQRDTSPLSFPSPPFHASDYVARSHPAFVSWHAEA